jgi:hypothetical protein
MESDDRVTGVIKQLDDALAELDKMDLLVGVYKTQLNVRLHFLSLSVPSVVCLPLRRMGVDKDEKEAYAFPLPPSPLPPALLLRPLPPCTS